MGLGAGVRALRKIGIKMISGIGIMILCTSKRIIMMHGVISMIHGMISMIHKVKASMIHRVSSMHGVRVLSMKGHGIISIAIRGKAKAKMVKMEKVAAAKEKAGLGHLSLLGFCMQVLHQMVSCRSLWVHHCPIAGL